jgi:long-chain acyl-CoA synthetase
MNDSDLLCQLNFIQIYFRGIRFDKQSILEAINHLAGYLTSNIHSSSPFILLSTYNHIKSLIAYYAIIKAGKIVAILDPETRSIELSEIIEDIDPAAIIFLNSDSIGFQYDEEILFRKQNSGFIINSDLKDVCTIAYTNAEDGYSKGAMITEKNLLSEVHALIKTNMLSENSVTCALLPFSHLFGLVQGILIPTHAGATGIIVEMNVLRISETIKEIQQYKVTHLYTVPSLYYILSKVPGIENLVSNILELYSGGTHLTPFIFNSFYRKTNRKIREGYGLTESSPGMALNYEEEGPKFESFGKPLPGCEIKIFNNDDVECTAGKIGEIRLKGDMVFQGYFNQEATTNIVLINGWLYTGDYGKKDKEGYLYFCGLKKDMINVAGNNVYPKKIERLLKKHKNVSDIKIFGEESVLQGQIVSAKIKLRDSSKKAQEEFKGWCYENINNALLPKYWLFG